MLSTQNEYLHPDYVQSSLPTMLDSKKSPLALLAQTCNNIGKDMPKSKPASTNAVESLQPTTLKRELPADADKGPTPAKVKAVSPLPQNGSCKVTPQQHNALPQSTVPVPPTASVMAESKPALSSNTTLPSPPSFSPSFKQQDLYNAFLNLSSLSSAHMPYLSQLFGAHHSPLDALAANLALQKSDPLSNYYAMLKAAAAAATSGYREPLCGHCCQHLSAGLHNQSCTSCKVCTHHQASPTWPQVAEPQLPFVCQWSEGGSTCGKRFATNPLLLEHIQLAHTAVSAPPTSVGDSLAARLPQPTPINPIAAAAAAASVANPLSILPHLPVTSQASLSPDSLRKAAANLSPSSRFHPYCRPTTTSSANPLSSVPGFNLSALQALNSLNPYAAFYGHRLGAAVP